MGVADTIEVNQTRYYTFIGAGSFDKNRNTQSIHARALSHRLATVEENEAYRQQLAQLHKSRELLRPDRKADSAAWQIYQTRYVRDQAGGFKANGARIELGAPYDMLAAGSAALYVRKSMGGSR
jgi:hypothetical protein